MTVHYMTPPQAIVEGIGHEKGADSALSTEHAFFGIHLLASFKLCAGDRLRDHDGLRAVFNKAITACGATVLNCSEHVFDGGGYTALFLLAESHASIHTYPEHGACFVDIFTCGTRCQPEVFGEIVKEYLQPKSVEMRLLTRHETIEG